MRWGCRGSISRATSEVCSIDLAFVNMERISKSRSLFGSSITYFQHLMVSHMAFVHKKDGQPNRRI